MERPDVQFTRADDGAYLACQVFGDGPVTLFWAEDAFAMVDSWWESPQERAWHEELAGFARIVIHDRRGISLSSRDVAPGNLEIQVADIRSRRCRTSRSTPTPGRPPSCSARGTVKCDSR